MAKISFEGFKENCLTFKIGSGVTLKKNDFVSITADGTVGAVAAGDIIGKCVDVKGSLATVQVSGYMTAPILSGETMTYGWCHAALDANGKAKIVSTARPVFVVEIGTSTVGFIL